MRTTRRGFPAPETTPERLSQDCERFLILRISDWERRFLRPGEGLRGKYVLTPSGKNDNIYELVRVDE